MTRIRTIEATGKRWKLLQLLGGMGIMAGLVMLAFSFAPGDHTTLGATGLGLIILSFLVELSGRAGAWWYHA